MGMANRIGDYVSVMKPPIALLNVFVGIVAIFLAVGLAAPMQAIFGIAAAGFFSAGGAGAINCYIDRELDRQMTRTRGRAIPSGRVSPRRILALGLIFSAFGIVISLAYLNLLTGFFMAIGIFWYIFVYTMWLKPITKWNIVIGGAAGCFSALAGWSAATGAVGLEGLLIAALIFLWTPGHFWGLAIAESQDYATANVPMMPVVEGIRRSSIYIAVSNVLLFPFTLALFLLTANWGSLIVTVLVAVALVALILRFVVANLRLTNAPNTSSAWRVFKLSTQYLFLALILIVIAHIL